MTTPSNTIIKRKPPFLIFIRHGQTDWNAEGRMQGQKDIPLNDTGRGQARRNGRALAEFFAQKNIDVSSLDFVSSPLARTRETMDLVREELGLEKDDYRLDDRLKEITFGAWEGFTLEELSGKEPQRVANRKADKWGFVPPEGESYRMLSSRIEAWTATLFRPMVVVSHGGVSRVLRGRLLGLSVDEIPSLDVPQDKVMIWRDQEVFWI